MASVNVILFGYVGNLYVHCVMRRDVSENFGGAGCFKLYFAHPVFEAYNRSGNFLLEKYIMKGIDLVYDRGIMVENLPSCGRVRLRKSENENFFALHVLYAPSVNRGNVCLLADFSTLHDVKFTVKVNEKISEVITEPDGEKLEFVQNGDQVTFTLKPFNLHKLVVLKW